MRDHSGPAGAARADRSCSRTTESTTRTAPATCRPTRVSSRNATPRNTVTTGSAPRTTPAVAGPTCVERGEHRDERECRRHGSRCRHRPPTRDVEGAIEAADPDRRDGRGNTCSRAAQRRQDHTVDGFDEPVGRDDERREERRRRQGQCDGDSIGCTSVAGCDQQHDANQHPGHGDRMHPLDRGAAAEGDRADQDHRWVRAEQHRDERRVGAVERVRQAHRLAPVHHEPEDRRRRGGPT